MMEVMLSSEKSVLRRATWRHIPTEEACHSCYILDAFLDMLSVVVVCFANIKKK
jgi:hypothetical protein